MMILRGKKLQEALLLVAEGRLSNFQIAERLQVSARILEATRGLPIFETRVAQIIFEKRIVQIRQETQQIAQPHDSVCQSWRHAR